MEESVEGREAHARRLKAEQESGEGGASAKLRWGKVNDACHVM